MFNDLFQTRCVADNALGILFILHVVAEVSKLAYYMTKPSLFVNFLGVFPQTGDRIMYVNAVYFLTGLFHMSSLFMMGLMGVMVFAPWELQVASAYLMSVWYIIYGTFLRWYTFNGTTEVTDERLRMLNITFSCGIVFSFAYILFASLTLARIC